MFFGCCVSDRKIKYMRCILRGNIFQSYRPNSIPNWSNWSVTLCPDPQMIKLNPNIHSNTVDKIRISNSFAPLSHYKIVTNSIEMFHWTSVEILYSTNWNCSIVRVLGMFSISHAKNANNEYSHTSLNSFISLSKLIRICLINTGHLQRLQRNQKKSLAKMAITYCFASE